ncbi:cytosine permease [Pandoraea sp. ISTKB]|uniref:purine-cytosine permease family protein n=1 Tax=Pandoraea sp. ISTKB TaxID=1586708 RepID=UPI000847A639|nr:allantoin permease [Pandoraea sp. ISTKB]
MNLQPSDEEQNSDFADRPIPEDQRMNKGPLTMAWWAVCSSMCWLVFSATMAINFGTVNALIGLGLTVICYSIVNGIIARYAINSGLSVALFSRILFGRSGAALATLIFFACATYYGLFEGSVISIALHSFVPAVPQKVMNLFVVVYSVLLVFGSVQKWLDKFNGVLLPFYLIGLITATALTIYDVGLTTQWLHLGPAHPSRFGWFSSFAYLMGVWIMMMFTFDYARFGKKRDVKYHARLNFGWPFYFFTFFVNGLVGIFLVGSLSSGDKVSELSVVFAILKLMGVGGLFFVWVSQTRINTANFYLAAVNLQSLLQTILSLKLPRFVCATVIGVLIYLLMLLNVFEYILQALAYQGVIVVAWVSIAVMHIVATRHSQGSQGSFTQEWEDSSQSSFNFPGIAAWAVSTACGITIMEWGGAIADFSGPITAVTASLLYGSLKFALPPKASVPSPSV